MTTRYSPQYVPQDLPRGLALQANANPLEDLFAKVEKFGQAAGMQAAADNASNAVLGGQNPDLKLPLSPAAVAYNQAARQAYQVRTETDLRAKTAEIATRFDGRNLTDPDSAASLYDAHAGEVLASVPDEMRGAIATEIQARRAALVSGITARAQHFELRRNVETLTMGIAADRDEAAVLARDGAAPEALAALFQRAAARAGQLVELGQWSQEQAAMAIDEARDLVRAEAIYGGGLRDGNLVELLDEVEGGGQLVEGMNLKTRDALARRLQQELAHRRSEANHALALQAKAVAQGDRDLNLLTRRLDLGVPLSESDMQRLSAYDSGELPASPVQLEEARASLRTFAVTREIATMSPQQFDAVRAHFATTEPASIEEALVRKRVAAAMDHRERELAGDDPMSYAMQAAPNLFRPVVLPADPEDPALPAALAQLADNADLLRAQYGVEASPLTKGQRQQVATWLSTMPVDEQPKVLGMINGTLGERAWRVYKDVAENGAKTIAHAGWLMLKGNKDLSASVLNGRALLASGVVKGVTPDDRDSALVNTGLLQVVPPEDLPQLVHAAEALLADWKSKDGTGALNLEHALEAVGGKTGIYRDRRILLPFGVSSARDFRDTVESATDEEVVAMGGTLSDAAALRDGAAELASIGDGLYYVKIGTVVRPWTLDYSKIQPKVSNWPRTRAVAEAVAGIVDTVIEGGRATLHRGPLDPTGRD